MFTKPPTISIGGDNFKLRGSKQCQPCGLDMTGYNDYNTNLVQKGYNDDNKNGVQSSDNHVGWI